MTGPATEVDLSWEGGSRFTASNAYGHAVTVDAPLLAGQPTAGFKPGELLMASLASCSSISAVSILRKKRQEVTGVEVHVAGAQESVPPAKWSSIHLKYTVRGRALDDKAVERSIHLAETKYCPVAATLGAAAEITSEYLILEEPVQ